MRLSYVLLALVSIAASLKADAPQSAPSSPTRVLAVRVDSPIKIDGRLDEPDWRDDRAANGFRQSEPTEGAPATESTSVDVLYDDQAIYIGARMHDAEPSKIKALLSRRDTFQNTDTFYFFVDPYHDRRTGYFFGLSAAGAQSDGTLFNDNWDDSSWDGLWEGKARIDENGWTAEMRIPYSQLRFHAASEHVWGVNFKRVIARKNESDYLVYVPRNESGFVSRFADMVGIDGIRPPRRLTLLPYATTKASYTHTDEGDPYNDGSVYDPGAGVDLKVGIGSNLTLDATLNPDFGQVEVDPAVVNLDDVETFFSEKRPFFIEGSSIFNFGFGGASDYWGFNWPGPDLFYSRRIGSAPRGTLPDYEYADTPAGTRIIGAGKLTGKLGNSLSVGVLQAVTAREDARISLDGLDSEAEIEPLASYGVYRLQKDIGDGFRGIGMMTTLAARRFADDSSSAYFNSRSTTVGADGWTFLDKDRKWVMTGWTAFSNAHGSVERISDLQQNSQHYFQRPDAEHIEYDPTATDLSGSAARFTVNKEKGNTFFNAALGYVSPAFDSNDLGFMWRSDVINMHIGAGYKWTKPGRLFRNAHVLGATFRSWDFGGSNIGAGLFGSGRMQFLNYQRVSWNVFYNPETFNNTRTRGGPQTRNPAGVSARLEWSSDDRKSWDLDLQAYVQESDSYRERSGGFEIEWRPAPNVSVSVEPTYIASRTMAQWVDVFEDELATDTYGSRYVFATMLQKEFSAGIRLSWTFTPTLSLQFYAQPLISAGAYSNYKELARPGSFDFREYDLAGADLSGDTYRIDPDGAGPAEPIEFSNPNFNYKSLRGNMVLRWEYRPGSTVYFVWTQSRTHEDPIGELEFGRSFSRLVGARADNVFLVKFSYNWDGRFGSSN